MTIAEGNNAALNCASNDFNHIFLFWLFNKTTIISSGIDYNDKKYKYEVLSGKLNINKVTQADSGTYMCISKSLDGLQYAVSEVEILVSSAFTPIDAVKLAAIIISIVVIMGSAILYYQLKKDWKKYEGRAVVAVDEPDEEIDGDEIYNQTTTSIHEPVAGPSRNQSSELLYGIDNQGLDTDFNSVFENIQIKSPHRSLI